MGVYIKGMEMPEDRPQLLWVYPNGKALTVQSDVDPWKDLQAVPVPPHGRLIDGDMLKKIVASSEHMDAGIFDGKLLYSDHLCVGADYEDVCKAIDETPTIIPAELPVHHGTFAATSEQEALKRIAPAEESEA